MEGTQGDTCTIEGKRCDDCPRIFEHRFEVAGEFPYHDTIYPYIQGKVIVSETASSSAAINTDEIAVGDQSKTPPIEADDSSVLNINRSNETESDFLTFVNDKEGVSIQYPSEWTEESFSNLTDDEIVPIVVISPPISRDPNANTFLEIGYDRSIQANNFSLDEYVRGVIQTQQSNSEISDFKVDSVKTDTIFANRSAYTIVSLRDADGISMKSFEVGTLIGEKLYYALFETEESKYNLFIPEVKKMVDSFELISDEVASINENDKITEVETTQSGDASSDDNSNTSFLSYENSKYGIRIQYPSSWTYENVRSNSGDELVDIVYFYPPSDPASAFGSGNVTIGYYDHLDENPTLEKFVDDHTEAYNSLGGLLGGKMDGKTDAMLAGRQAYSLVTTTTEDGTDGKSIEVGTFVGNKRHFIYFDAEKQDYNTLLPDVQKMIDSFEITVDPDK